MTSSWEFADRLWLMAETAVARASLEVQIPTYTLIGVVVDATSAFASREDAATMASQNSVGMGVETLSDFGAKLLQLAPSLFPRMSRFPGEGFAWCLVSVDGRTEFEVRDIRPQLAAFRAFVARTAAPPPRRVSPGLAHGHGHAEAFCLMHYRGETSGEELLLWNSRDGVTPFGFRHPVTGEEYRHVDFHRDRYAPDHRPRRGDFYFEDLTYERALARRRRFAVAHWDTAKDGWPALRDHYPGKTWEEAAEELARKDIEPPGRPTLSRWGMEDE